MSNYNYVPPSAPPDPYGVPQSYGDTNPAPPSASAYPPLSPAKTGAYEQTPLTRSERFNYAASQYRDPWFVLLFVLHIGGMCTVAALYGQTVVDAIRAETSEGAGGGEGGGGTNEIEPKVLVAALAVSTLVALVFSIIWLKVIQNFAKQIIQISLVVSSLWVLAFAGTLAYAGSYFAAGLMMLLPLLNCLYYYAVRSRIPFTQAILNASSVTIQDHHGAVVVTLVIAVVQVLWAVFWAFCTLAIYYKIAPPGTDPDGHKFTSGVNLFYFFLLLISFYWTGEVLKNTAHVTTAGSVASWWLVPSNLSPTVPSMKRALTTSFGSICFGSLIVAILSATATIARMMRDNARRSENAAVACLACLLVCMVECLESMMEFFNVYAFTQVAVYGKPFMTAAKDTWALFKRNGWDLIINDDLTGMVIFMGCLSGGMAGGLSGVVVVAVSSATGTTLNWTSAGIAGGAGFLTGFVMLSLVMTVLRSAVATTFVLWAEDPASMQNNRQAYYAELQRTARQRFPDREW